MRRTLLLATALAAACSTDVAPENPFDPATPPEQQAKAEVRAAIATGGLASVSGQPVALRANGRVVRNASTGAGGAFVFDQLVPGAYGVEVSATGFAPVSIAVSLRPGDRLDLGTLQLQPLSGASASAIVGTVLLAGGAVDHSGTLVEAVGRSYSATTATSGAFRLDVIPGTYLLRVSHPDFTEQGLDVVDLAPGEERTLGAVTLATNPATVTGSVDGELQAGGAAPLADATVTLEGTSITGFTNAAGDYTLTGVPSGSYVLRIAKDGFVSATVPVLGIRAGTVVPVEDVALALARGAIAGQVALAGSSDASGAVVEVTGTGRAAITGADGLFRFEGLVAGVYEVSARRDGYQRTAQGSIQVTAGGTASAGTLTLARQGGAVTIAEGAFTASRRVHLQLAASGVSDFRASEDPGFAGTTWRALTPGQPVPFDLSDADGEHVVYVQFSNGGASPSAPSSAAVVLDRLAPGQGTVAIGGGTGWSNAADGIVSLALSAQDRPAVEGAAVSGVGTMQLVAGAAFDAGAAQTRPYGTSETFTLPPGDGPRTVWVRFVDRAGNASTPVSASVIVDTVAPALTGPLRIAGSDAGTPDHTRSAVVTLELDATDANAGPAGENLYVRLSNASGLPGALYQPYAPRLSWLLSPGDGAKTVYAQLMDAAGNVSAIAWDDIALDTAGPSAPALAIEEGDARPSNGRTNVATVTLVLSAAGEPVRALVSEDAGFASPATVVLGPLPHRASHVLSALGTRTVYARFLDGAGNASDVVQATVTLDQTPPLAVAPAVSPAPYARTAAVTVTPPAAGQDELRVTGTGVIATGFQAAPAGVGLPVQLSAGDGPKAFTVTYRDDAENLTTVAAPAVALDGTPPAAASFSIEGALADGTSSTSVTSTRTVTLALSASDAASGVEAMLLSESPAFTGAPWQPYAAAAPFTLSSGDGTKTVYARFRDAAGNETAAAVQGQIALDTSGPTSPALAVVGAGGDPLAATSTAAVRVRLSAAGAPARALVAENPALTGATVVDLAGQPLPHVTGPVVTLSGGDGPKTLYVRYVDAAGNPSDPAVATVVLDTTAPAGPATFPVAGKLKDLSASTSLTAQRAVTADLSGVTDAAGGLASMQLSESPAFAGATWVPFAASAAFALSAGDGPRTLYARFRDAAGNVSATASQGTTVLDESPPSAAAFAVQGALVDGTASGSVTATRTVSLALSGASDATSGLDEVLLSESAAFAGATWQPYAATAPFTLSPGDGTKTVYARFRDAAGNETAAAVQGQIALDTTGPASPALAVVGAAGDPLVATSTAAVRLRLSATGTPVRALVAENPAFTGATVVDLAGQLLPHVTGPVLTLSAGDGAKTVYARYLDAAGNPSDPAVATVVLDASAPAAPATFAVTGKLRDLTASSALTAFPAVTLDLSGAADGASGVAQVQLSESPAFAGASWVPFAASAAFTLSPGDGTRTVYARFRDAAGNVSATSCQGTIVLDQAAPAAAAFSIQGALVDGSASTSVTAARAVILALSGTSDATSGLAEVLLSESAAFAGATWQPHAAAAPFTLSAGDGPKTVYARFRDAAGNETAAAVQGQIALDTAGPASPVLEIVTAAGAPLAATSAAAVHVRLDADGGATRALVADNPVFLGAAVVSLEGEALPYVTPAPAWTLLPPDGTKTLYVRYADAAGNLSGLASATVSYDTTAPLALPPEVTPSPYASTGAVTLVPPDAGQATMDVAGEGVVAQADVAAPPGAPVAVALTAGDGEKAFSVTWRDAAGNETTVSGLSVTLDTTAPAASAFAVAGTLADGTPSTSLTATASVTLDLAGQTDATSGVADVMLSNDGAFTGATWQPFVEGSQVPWVLGGGDGTKTVYARFRDRVGKVTGAVQGQIELLATPPSGGALTLAAGARTTGATAIAVALQASGAHEMQLSVDGLPGAWEPFAASTTVTLSAFPDEATRTVAVTFRSRARVEGAGASASIFFDRRPPAAPSSVSITGTLADSGTSAQYAATPIVVTNVGWSAADVTVNEMVLFESTTCALPATPAWQPLASAATFVFSGGDGAKGLCVALRDEAGNAGPGRTASIVLDTTVPPNPSFEDLAAQVTNASQVTGTVAALAPDPGGTPLSYECLGGLAFGGQWRPCTPDGARKLTFTLARDQDNTLGIRTRDAARNASAGTMLTITQDAIAPQAPIVLAARTTRDSLTVTWAPGGDADVQDLLVHYGNSVADRSGGDAAQGLSPIAVGRATATSFALTGLTPGVPYYVSVEAVDRAGNRSGPSAPKLGVPNVVNPRVLGTIGGRLEAVTGAVGTLGKTFAYVAAREGMLQLDVTSDVAAPTLAGRAATPDFIPDHGGAIAALSCTVDASAGRCVVVPGITREGVARGGGAAYRAHPPVVWFPDAGGPGRVLATLPVRPHRVAAAVLSGRQVLFAVDLTGVSAFDLSTPTQPRLVASAPFAAPATAVKDVGIVNGELAVARSEMVSFYPLAGVLSGSLGTPRSFPVDLTSPDVSTAFSSGAVIWTEPEWDFDPENGAMISYLSILDPATGAATTGIASYQDAWATLVGVPGAVYAIFDWGDPYFARRFVATPAGVLAAGTNTPVAQADGGIQGLGGFVGAGGVERLLAVRTTGTADYRIERWKATAGVLARAANPYQEVSGGELAVFGDVVVSAHDDRLDFVDLGNPLSPSATTRASSGKTYRRVLTRGPWLYAGWVGTNRHGADIFRFGSSAAEPAYVTSAMVSVSAFQPSFAVAGRHLFIVDDQTVRPFNISNPAAPAARPTQNTGLGIFATAVAARPQTVGGIAYDAVLYVLTVFREFQAFGYRQGVPDTWTPLGTRITLPGELDMGYASIRLQGPYAVVGNVLGTVILDVSNAAAPAVVSPLLATVAGPAILQGGYLTGLGHIGQNDGPNVAIASSGALDGTVPFTGCTPPSSTEHGGGFVADGATYYASCGDSGIMAFAVADPLAAPTVKRFDGFPLRSFATDGVASYVAGGEATVSRVYRIDERSSATGTTPAAPAVYGTLADGDAYGLAFADGLLWVLEGGGAGTDLFAYDVSSPSGWTLRGQVDVCATPVQNGLATDGEYLYVACGDAVRSVDVKSMTVKAISAGIANITALHRWGPRLYAGTSNGGVVRLDLADGSFPSSGTLGGGHNIAGLAARGAYLFFTTAYAQGGLWRQRHDGLDTHTLVWDAGMPLGQPAIAGDRMLVPVGLRPQPLDLTDFWQGRSTVRLMGPAPLPDPGAQPGALQVLDGPFGYTAGQGYRASDLRQ